eukprot:CAMPEP_0113936908 /NCGR_PEP_ID=MMETSP1339-20121228/3652_1 /TAXON_ID=94617 /ORGANISM="Fibrocapsa japonica" /LENGTH=405 /DNA_ID=CAMNT_0000939481 /DNA_START=157 /DNA_END=1371 /DNA_ORIENTATION=- /assembly_acc=CAM_ASM_000762
MINSINFRSLPRLYGFCSMRALHVYSQGEALFGSLGNGTHKINHDKATIIKDLEDKNILEISAGWGHSAAIGKSKNSGRKDAGEIWVWGRPFEFKTLLRLHNMYRLWSPIGNLAAAQGAVNKEVFLSPRQFVLPGGKSASSIRTGAGVTLTTTECGEVYAFGLNQWGQCGIGNDKIAHVYQPTQVQALEGHKIAQVELGFQHCLARSVDGRLFTWGKGERGQLGNGRSSDLQNRSAPIEISLTTLPGQEKATKVACGFNHSAAITDQGNLYVWGKLHGTEADDSKLSVHTKNKDQLVPRKVELAEPAKDLHATAFQTAVELESGELWVMGVSSEAKLPVMQPVPLQDYFSDGTWRLRAGLHELYLFNGKAEAKAVNLGMESAYSVPLDINMPPNSGKLLDMAVGW